MAGTEMKLYRTLADGILQAHPEDAARVLESLPEDEVQAVLEAARAGVAAGTLRRMAVHRAASTLENLDRARAGAMVQCLELDLAANILRRMDGATRNALLDTLEADPAKSLRALLRFPEGTAGALMDPSVLALPGDMSVQQALVHIREHPEQVRYNLYVLDREQVLVGVLNLRELLVARRKDILGAIAHAGVLSIPARADRHAILTHPAWRDARSVPVIDERGVYLGAVRYQTLRRLEEELREGAPERGASTTAALGELFSTGIGGILTALVASVAQPFPGGDEREP